MSDPVTGIITGASTLLGMNASKQAASAQSDAADKAAQLQQQQYDQTAKLQKEQYDQARADQEPFRQAGITSQNRLMELLGIGGNAGASDYGRFGRDFSMSDFQQDPGYAFRVQQGQQAIDRSAAARGGLQSGAALKAAARYGQDVGSQEYQNAFNRYQINRNNQINPLQSFMGAGQSATNFAGQAGQNYAGAMGNAGQNYANNAGEAYQGAGNARASGYVGQANAISNGLGSYLNYQNSQNMLNALRPASGNIYAGGMSVPNMLPISYGLGG